MNCVRSPGNPLDSHSFLFCSLLGNNYLLGLTLRLQYLEWPLGNHATMCEVQYPVYIKILVLEDFKIVTVNQSDTNHCVIADFMGAVEVVQVSSLIRWWVQPLIRPTLR